MQDKTSKNTVLTRWNAGLEKKRYCFFQNQTVEIGRINNALLYLQDSENQSTRIIISKDELKELIEELTRYIPND